MNIIKIAVDVLILYNNHIIISEVEKHRYT